jgi:glycosyltransferase involved in cell wall biosynthesis
MVSALAALGACREKIAYTPCAPQDSFFQVSPRLSEQTFAAAGRFVNKKAPYYTVLAFDRVLKSHPGARLFFAGEGPLLNACRNIARHLGCEHAVTFPGAVDPPALQDVFARARGFVQHSITADDGDSEGTPVAVLEAGAAGLPVVATAHAGIPDVVVHGQTGLLVAEHDVDGMADAMRRLLDDREYAVTLGRQARQHVQDNFSMQQHISILSALIDR